MHWEEREGGRVFVFEFEEVPEAYPYLRQYLGMSQRQLGQAIGVHQQTISLYERTGYAHAALARLKEIMWAYLRACGGNATITATLPPLPPTTPGEEGNDG